MIKKEKNEATWNGAIVAICSTLLARGLGFIRELITASMFGTSAIGDAFIVSMTIPDVLVSGFSFAVASLYIPTIQKIRQECFSKNVIDDFNSSILLFLLLLSSAIVAIVEIFPSTVVELFASGFDSETTDITIRLTKIVALSIIPVCLGSFFKAYGQMINRYSLMTRLGLIINVTIIAGLYLSKGEQITILGISVLLGNIIYTIICGWYCCSNGLRLSKHGSFGNKYLLQMTTSVIPVFISEIISEVNQLVDKNFASRLPSGTISALNYSSKVINLVTAIIGTTLASIFFTKLSEQFAQKRYDSLADYIIKINEMALTILIPIMMVVVFFPDIIVKTLFGRGRFSNQSILITSECLMFYSIGIIGFNLKAIWTRIYNSSLQTRALAINSAIAVVLNVFLNILFIRKFRHVGLASATCVSSLITDFLLVLKYQKINPCFSIGNYLISIIKLLACSSAYFVIYMLGRQLLTENLVLNVFIVLLLFVLATVLYIIFMIGIKTVAGIEIENFISKGRGKK